MSLPFDPSSVLLAFLGSLRVAVVLFMLPMIGGELAPAKIRVALSLAIGFLVTPAMSHSMPDSGLALALALGRELAIGSVLGFFVRLFVVVPQIAGDIIAQELGVRMAQEVDPTTQIPTTAIGRMYEIVFLLLFLGVNGHHDVMRGIALSFRTFPLGESSFPSVTSALGPSLGICLRQALIMATPLFSVLLIMTFVLALISKSVTQINIMNFGIGLRLTVGLFAATLLFPLIHRPGLQLVDTMKRSILSVVGG